MEQEIETTIFFYIGNVRVRASVVGLRAARLGGHVFNVHGMFV